ncbi:MAG: MBL fold metallo-hydrolase, partial [bacterium]|nr:MBL fold metallo-hydrolase [bacterium]
MEVQYLGHSSFRIKGKSVTIVTDPYDSAKVGLKFPKVDASIVTVSHDHDDHNVISQVDGEHKDIVGPGEYEIGGTSIFGIPSFHDDKEGAERGRN